MSKVLEAVARTCSQEIFVPMICLYSVSISKSPGSQSGLDARDGGSGRQGPRSNRVPRPIWRGDWPLASTVHCVTNDFSWWLPSGLCLRMCGRSRVETWLAPKAERNADPRPALRVVR